MSVRERTTSGPTLMQRVWTWLHHQPVPMQNGSIVEAMGITRNQCFCALRDLKRVNAVRLGRGRGAKGAPGRPVWRTVGEICPEDRRLRPKLASDPLELQRKRRAEERSGIYGRYKLIELEKAWCWPATQRNAPALGADD
jgi:hypothetical protein